MDQGARALGVRVHHDLSERIARIGLRFPLGIAEKDALHEARCRPGALAMWDRLERSAMREMRVRGAGAARATCTEWRRGVDGLMDGLFAGARGRPAFVAHRGASNRAIENSIEAISMAVDDGADMVEIDVRVLVDGTPVVVHDARTGRTAREDVVVERCEAKRFGTIRLRNEGPIPLLRDALSLVGGRVPLNLDIKVVGGTAAVVRVLSEVGYGRNVFLSSALRSECAAARVLAPELACGLVTGRPSASDLAFCRRHALVSIHADHRKLSVLRVRKVHAAGLALVAYTVDESGRLSRLVEMGVDGVFSNRAKELREAWWEETREAG